MKRQLLLLLGVVLCACTPNPYGRGVPASYVPLLDAALEETPRADSLRALLSDTPCEEREAMAYLIAWMPRATATRCRSTCCARMCTTPAGRGASLSGRRSCPTRFS